MPQVFSVWLTPARGLRFAYVCAMLIASLAFLSLATARSESGLEPIEITTSSGVHTFQVEIAKDEASREKGLMYRRFMPADRGMLFEFEREEPVAFWMHNTYIPLDMIFITHDGTVARVAANAEPLTDTAVPSGAPVIGVLELNGGEAARINLKPGDKVSAPFFKP